MNILVTGGAGYIGSHVVKQLLETTDHDVTVLDSLVTGFQQTVDTLKTIAGHAGRGVLSFHRADLADFAQVEALFGAKRFNAVIHFAASLVVPESVRDPLKYYMNNTVNTAHLVRLCRTHGVDRFIFSSTAAVYGEPEKMPIRETTPTRPINPYGSSKLMSETVLRDTAAADDAFRYVALRYFNVAGADPLNRIGECHDPETHLIPLIVKAALGTRESITLFGEDYDTPDGTCVRDYIHVEDLASAHIAALEYLEAGAASEVFNCGYGHGFSVSEVIETVREVSGVDFTVVKADRRPGDPAELVADTRRIRETLQWTPRYDDLRFICKTALAWEEKHHAALHQNTFDSEGKTL